MVDLKNIIESGIINDLLKAEKAFNVIKVIGDYSEKINQSETPILDSLSYFQRISLHEFVLSISRIYDKPSKRNKTRCLEKLINLLIEEPNNFPKIREIYQTERQLNHYNLSHLIFHLKNKNQSIFTAQLGVELYEEFQEIKKEREIIKSWRDHILTHNDTNNKVDNINFQDTGKLLDLGWKIVTILGWAYLSTVYGLEGKYNLREDIIIQRFGLKKFLEITLNRAPVDNI